MGKKFDGTLAQGFLYRDAIKPVVELDGAGNVVSRFVYGTNPATPDYVIKGGSTYKIFSDQIGSPRVVVDVSSGSVVERIDYDERGNTLNDTNAGFIPFGFAGGIVDRDTALIRFGARDYDPSVGRWTEKDSAGFNGGLNFYVYAGNDAINNVDPSGHIFWYIAAAGAFAAADLAFQLGNNNHDLDCVDWGEVAEAGLFGLGIGELAAGAFAVEGAGALEAAEAEEACAGGACEGGACFAPETKVATADGEVAIADIKVGDKVWSKDETTGETTLEVVARRYVTPNEQLLDLDVSADGREELIRATPAHPFWVDGQGWTSAGDLRAGDQFDLRSGKHAVLARVEQESGKSTVYNLEVAGSHSYFVGDDGVWVHNGCGDELPSLDATGKVHGDLPQPADFGRYSDEELEQLRNELEQSVETRIQKTVDLGSDFGHGERQGAEQQLIR